MLGLNQKWVLVLVAGETSKSQDLASLGDNLHEALSSSWELSLALQTSHSTAVTQISLQTLRQQQQHHKLRLSESFFSLSVLFVNPEPATCSTAEQDH